MSSPQSPEPTKPSADRPSLQLLIAVALLSAAVLIFEVALTRVFAVLLRYHFAFLVISIALCGLGIGGYASYWLRRRFALSLPLLGMLFGVAVDLAMIAMLRGVFAISPGAYWMAAVLVLIPFSFAGAFLSEAFARCPQWSGRLYAWDLAGAAVAAVSVVGLLQVISAIDVCLFAALLGAVAGIGLLGQDAAARWPRSLAAAITPLLGVVWLLNCALGWSGRAPIFDIPAVPPQIDREGMSLADKGMTQPLFTELGTPGHTSRIIDTRWSAFARTDVVADPMAPDSFLLYSNGNVPTNMMHWDGDLNSVPRIGRGFPVSDWAFAIAPLEKPQSKVLSIGPGGGLDALLALSHGAKRFDGAEINPSIIGLMNEPKYVKWNGGIYQRPEVHVATADGRAFVREATAHGDKYELLFSALTKTATAAQGMALLESYIYTQDAFADYLDALTDDGQMTIVGDAPGQTLMLMRFVITALAELKKRGLSEQEAMKRVAIIYYPQPGPYQFAFVVSKKPFTRAQNAAMMDAALKRGLTPVWIPDQAASSVAGPFPELGRGELTIDKFIGLLRANDPPLDISPCPDNRPFVLDLQISVLPVFKQLAIFAVVLAFVLAALGWFTSERGGFTDIGSGDIGAMVYFLALGVGFMMVEIPLAQKLILPLGYPTLALTVILFSILLGGGLGAHFSQTRADKALTRWATLCAIGVALGTVLAAWLINAFQDSLLLMALPLRCALAALLLLPLGFLLGTPFPSGMRLLGAGRENHIPLIWGLNGVASVVGSLCAAMGAKLWGFDNVLYIGAVIYVVAAVLIFTATPKTEVPVLAEPEPPSAGGENEQSSNDNSE